MINNPKKALHKEKKKYQEIIDKRIKDQQKNTDKFINSKLTLEEYQRLQNKAKDDVMSSRLALKRITDYETGNVIVEKRREYKIPTNPSRSVRLRRIDTSELAPYLGSEGVEL